MLNKNKLSLFLLAGVILFMQAYLFQHELSHTLHDHAHEHEIIQECQLCLGAQTAHHFILPENINLSLSLMCLIIVFSYGYVTVVSPAFLFPHTRAPPVTDLFI